MKRACYILTTIMLSILPAGYSHAASLTSANYTMQAPNITASAGASYSLNYTFSNVSIGGTFGDISHSESFSLHAGFIFEDIPQTPARLSISLYPATCPLGLIAPGETSYAKIEVTNDGNIKECFNMRVTDTTGKKWTASDEIGGNTINTYLMSGLFTSINLQQVDATDFAKEDIMLEDLQPKLATDTVFATPMSHDNGTNVLPNKERALWIKFDAPNVDTTRQQHNIWIIVGAEVQEEN